MKKLADHLKNEQGYDEEKLKEFKSKMQNWVTGLVKKERFKDLQFWAGEGENAADGQLAILEYRDVNGTEVPIVMLVKPGLIAEKC